MPSNSYNTADIPRELQRLIDHTDRGIEQLYQLAGESAKLTEGARRGETKRGPTQRQRQQRAQRDSYYYDPVPAPRASTQRRGAPSAASSSDEDDYPKEEEAEDSDDSDGDAYEEVVNISGDRGRLAGSGWSGQRDSRQRKGNRSHAPTARPHHNATSSYTTQTRAAASLRGSPASTPNRNVNHLSRTPFSSSPASLEKPPYAPQPALPSPSSFLSSSLPNLSASAPPPPPPPWQLRRHSGRKATTTTATMRSSVVDSGRGFNALSRGRAGSTHHGGSPSSLNDSAAYRTHLAAQQSTQKPDAAAAAAARQRRYRSLLFTDADEDASAATPDSHRAMHDNSLAEASSHHHSGSNVNTSFASAGMLSRFGKRWGAVFEDMLAAPPPPPSPPEKAAIGKPARAKLARGEAADRRRVSSMTSSSSSTNSDNEVEDERKVRPQPRSKSAAEKEKRPQREEERWQAAPLTASSTSIHAAAEALAARPRTSPNSSGIVATVKPSLSPLPAYQSSADARIIEQLRADLQTKEEAMLQLRMDHAREMAEVRQSSSLERASAAKNTADELATTYGIQQQLLQTSLQTERERVAEAEEQLRLTRREAAQRKLDLEDATHALETLQSKHTTLANAHQELVAQSAQWRAHAEKASTTVRQLEAQEKVWKAKEVDWQARETQLQQRLEAAEVRLRQQEASAQEVLAQVETEFTQTSQSYQDLLAEATKRMSYLEKSHRKYKVMKESHNLLKTEHAQLVESALQRTQRHESEVSALTAEVLELRRQLHQRDSVSQEASESYQETLRDYKRRLELQEANAAEHAQTLQQHIATANHTIELLRTQLESAKQEVLEEQRRSQQQQMEAAQAELHARENLAEQQRSAAAFKVRTEDVIAQQKRQLKEKDTKMQALAAGAAEPVQRLREQLEDERGRRARLEEQLKTYKRKAKQAEEHAAAEIRREQLRNALLSTPAASASASAPQRLLRSATATPSVHSTSPPRPFFAVSGTSTSGQGGAAPPVALSLAARRSATASSSADGAHRNRGASPFHAARPPTAVVRGTTPSAEGTRVGGATKQRQRSPPHTPTSSPAVDGFPPTSHAPQGSAFTRAGGHPHISSLSPPASAQPSASNERRRSAKEKDVAPVAAGAGLVGTPAISPNATVQSISGISHSTPYTSTLLGDAELERATAMAAASGGGAGPPSEGSASGQRKNDLESERESDDAAHGGTASALPWYAQKARRQGKWKEEEEEEQQDLPRHERPHASFSPPRTGQEDAVATTQVFTDAGMQEHEERMRTFHSSALEVMRRFAGSRQEALARCADIVKQTAVERRRDAQARSLRESDGRASPAAAAAADASDSESESQ
ncbi:hypothetical protein ABB37_08652 [Leptomonas pyrrhocoris]|uniref:Uncharacterized protein n=1 Tax=Leptomonas pyrrhocoris TaxID=157538 RepID=A0A0N0DS41_LEPPY|nr:hypothetical protein ABB37_08652 [Leptomonas pyrrhocoris]XP_015653811.1 hypothetical protein ABB37_08652 [Leptomonas pyrrhocoris]XP_015653812.1 hypothetical protein ABB37_08652 [Leptomonas pyrrhocoris]KPA75371.1 hypothetical protein ABB37_08652 [Leptomonas pyrrhocoris]KPA75372.1 hypothetical protein ABB37_08652 [Leptomonas pyrrhocoris]KPA75373.1 hypothetical protein ABB37_08652 [Leptomonas pyrrhocoris]|eukprot:XP_015653810.1 hypothetical protein ABB37_08652 [Leptomonas pyrrhocoris]